MEGMDNRVHLPYLFGPHISSRAFRLLFDNFDSLNFIALMLEIYSFL